MNWLAVKTAPCGSRNAACFVHSVSSLLSTVAPSDSASATDSSRSATVKVTCQCGTEVSRRREAADDVGETGRCRGLSLVDARIDGRGQMVAVARDLDHGRETHVDEDPAEDLLVERLLGLGIGGPQVAEVPRAWRVRDLCTEAVLRLPQPELHPGRIGADRGPAALACCLGWAGHADLRRPRRRPRLLRCRRRRRRCSTRRAPTRSVAPVPLEAGDVLAVELGDDVGDRCPRWCGLVERPAEQPAVEGLRRLEVIDLDVDPRGDAVRVGACLSHEATL